MFDGIVHAWRLRKLQSSRRDIQRFYQRAVKDAEAARKPALELERLFFEERMEVRKIDAEIHSLLTWYLIRTAERRLISYPEFKTSGGFWVQSDVTGRWHLSTEALAELRSAVRHERKERSENWRVWLAAWTGLIGTLIGLAALLLKR